MDKQPSLEGLPELIKEQRAASILESITDGFVALDDEWRFTYVNVRAEEIISVPRERLLGRLLFDVFPIAADSPNLPLVKEAITKGQPLSMESPSSVFPGRWFEFNLYPFEGGCALFFRDITDRKEAEAALREQREWFETTLSSIGDAVIATDSDGTVTFLNPVAEDLTGWRKSEAIGSPVANVFNIQNEYTKGPVESPVDKVRREGVVVGLANHTVLVRPDGTEIPIDDSGAPIRDADGNLVGVVMVFHDITERRRSEEERHRREQEFRALAENAPDLIVRFDSDLRHVYINPVIERISGLSPHIFIGKTSRELRMPDELTTEWERVISAVFETGEEQTTEFQYDTPEGRTFLSARIAPEFDTDGRVATALSVVRDLTDLHNARLSLEESESRFRLMADTAPVLIWMSGTDALRDFVNKGWLEFTGRTVKQELGEGWMEGVHPDDRDRLLELYRSSFEAQKDFRIDFRLRRHDGVYRWVMDTGVPRFAEDGKFLGFIGSCLDIHDRIAAEDALKESERRFRSTFENAAVGIALTDADGRWLSVNERMCEMAGYSQEELLQMTFRDITHPEDVEADEALLETLLAGDIPNYSLEKRYIRKDGSLIWVEITVSVMKDPSGQEVEYLIGIVKDISSKREAETQLKESEQRLKLAMDAGQMGAWQWDVSSDIVTWTEKLEEMHGLEPGSFGGKSEDLSRLIHPDDLDRVLKTVTRSAEQRSPYRVDYRIVKPDGEISWLEASGRVSVDEGGESVKLAGVCMDVTERKQVEKSIRENEERLLQLNQTLEQRVEERTGAMLAYQRQLRSLASKLSAAEQRERRRVATELHDNLAQILAICKMKLAAARKGSADGRHELDSLDRSLDDALKYTRTLVSDLSPPFNLGEDDLGAAVQWVGEKMTKHGLKVKIEDDGKPKPLAEDVLATTFESVRELLFNVVRHSGVDEAMVFLRRKGSTVSIVVLDDGNGFDPEKEGQGPSSDDGGFGLFSIRERVDLLGGSMEIYSAPGQGTRVILSVPVMAERQDKSAEYGRRKKRTTSEPPTIEVSGAQIRVLLVDDHEMMREGLRSIISGEEDMVVVAEASDGEMAVRCAHEFHPDVVVMDVGMPKKNGMEATEEIVSGLPHVKVIALSLNESEEAVAAMQRAGASDYLFKSQAFDTLCAAIRRCAAVVE